MDVLNTVDWIIIVLCAIGAIWGAIKGFIDEFSQKTGYIAGLLAALMFTKAVAPLFSNNFNLPTWVSALIAYVLLFIVGYLLIKMLGTMLKGISDTASISFLDNLLGFFLGLLESVLVIGMLETLLSYQSMFDLSEAFRQSFISSNLIMPMFNIVSTQVQGII